MDYEGGLISGVVLDGDIVAVLDLGVTLDLFSTHKEQWEYIQGYYLKHGVSPPENIFCNRFKGYELRKLSLPYSVLLEEMKKRYTHKLISQTVKDSVDHLKKKEPMRALDSFKKMIHKAELSVVESRDLELTQSTEERKLRYLEAKKCGGIIGFTTPWSVLDRATLGLKSGEFWLIAARSSVGKSWCIVVLARHFWFQEYRVLAMTKEMEPWQLGQRFDAIHAGISYRRFREGNLTQTEESRLFSVWEEMRSRPMIHIVGGSDGVGGVSSIEAKIDKHRPQIVLIDGLYMIPDERKGKSISERINNVSEDLQAMTKRREVLTIASHQFNLAGVEDKGSADTLAYGDIQKWFDGIIGMYRDDNLKKSREMYMKLLKHREGETIDFVTGWDLDSMDFSAREEGASIDVEESAIDF